MDSSPEYQASYWDPSRKSNANRPGPMEPTLVILKPTQVFCEVYGHDRDVNEPSGRFPEPSGRVSVHWRADKVQSRDASEQIFLVRIFFYCLDYVSRLQKNCSEYSGKLKHASAMDSVLKLSLKMMGNRWMFRRCSPIIYTCLPPEIHPHGQNGTITREIINIIKKNSVMSQKTTK